MARPSKEGKDDILDNAEQGLLRYLQVIRDIRDGMSELDACRKNAVSRSAFRRCVFHTKANLEPMPHSKDPALDEILLGPAERLYIDVFNVPRADYDGIPSGLDETMALAIDKLLNENQKTVIHSMYYEHMTLDDISGLLGLTGERVRIIGRRARYCLRTPQVKALCAAGMERYRELLAKRSQFPVQPQKENEELFAQLTRSLDMARCEDDFNKARDAYLTAIDRITKNTGHKLLYRGPEHITEQTVAVLPISTRMTNALTERGYTTVKAVLALSLDEVRSWRNIGKDSIKTLVDALAEYGLSLNTG